jgi:hypothetical protein
MEPTIERQMEDLTHWTRTVKAPLLAKKRAEEDAKDNDDDNQTGGLPGNGNEALGGVTDGRATDAVTMTNAALR